MITSLLEPCLIIPNYAARHLLLSVSPAMLPAHSWPAALCVFSHLDIIDERVPHILAGYSAGPCAVVLIMQDGIVQGGVYSSSLFSLICYAVYPNTEHAPCQAQRVADAPVLRDELHSSWEGNKVKVPKLTRFK